MCTHLRSKVELSWLSGRRAAWPGTATEDVLDDDPLLLLLRNPDASSHAVRLVLLWLSAERER
jgi:hypothetical protein